MTSLKQLVKITELLQLVDRLASNGTHVVDKLKDFYMCSACYVSRLNVSNALQNHEVKLLHSKGLS